WGATSPRAPCWPPTGRACSRWAWAAAGRGRSAGGAPTRAGSCPWTACASPAPWRARCAAPRCASTRPSPPWSPAAPTRAAPAGGSPPTSLPPTRPCTSWGGRTRWRRGWTASSPAASTGSPWAACSPGSRCSPAAPTPPRPPWWAWSRCSATATTGTASSTSSGAPSTWRAWGWWTCRARSTCAGWSWRSAPPRRGGRPAPRSAPGRPVIGH
ncbi:MAG: Leucyl/phenylalanyl-tRNA--protein transferase, partial [uncultured Quadrisphaera sp.]